MSSKQPSALGSFIRFCKAWKWKIIFVASIFTLSDILLAIIPILIGGLIEVLSSDPSNHHYAWWFVAGLIICSSGHDIVWRTAEFAYRGFLNEIGYKYETYLYTRTIRKPYPFFVDKLSGKIGSYITLMGTEFRDLISEACFSYTGQIVGVIATILILGSLNWQSAAVFVVGVIGMVIVGRYTLAYNMKYEARSADALSTKNGKIFDSITNFASVKSFKTEHEEIRLVEKAQNTSFLAGQKAFLSGIIFWASMSFFVRHVIWVLLVILNVQYYFAGQLSIGQLATMLSTAVIFSATIWDLIWSISQFGLKMARINEAYSYVEAGEPDTLREQKSNDTVELKKNFELRDLSFAYPDAPTQNVLHDISLTIKKGEKIGVVGHSGGGKSTITKLLLDFYEIGDAMMYVDGVAVTPRELSNLVSYVPQDTTLFHRSISENIRYGTPESTNQDVRRASKQAKADEFIVQLAKGYETLVGERGVKLSGGQRQRIAIARAMLQQKPILILDEATSALDSESEKYIQQALEELMKDRTSIVIAHRLSTIVKMDRIIVLEGGSIVEDGTHTELLEQNGIYAKLWAHQSGGFIEE